MTNDRIPIGPEEARQIAFEGCVAVYPALLLDCARRRHPAPANQFVHLRARRAETVLGLAHANPHVLYSIAWLDLTTGPVVISLPELRGRYMSMAMIDAWGEVLGSLGVRAMGDGACDVAVVDPFWSGPAPADMRVLRAPTGRVWLLGRTLCDGEGDEAAARLCEHFYLTPLGRQSATSAAEPAAWRGWPAPSCESWRAEAILDHIGQLLADDPPPRALAGLIERLSRLGVGPQRPFDLSSLPTGVADAVRQGVSEALGRVADAAWSPEEASRSHWLASIDHTHPGCDRLRRAAAAHRCLGFNLGEDAAYFLTDRDADGQPLDGAARYRLRLKPRGAPPAGGFWSLCAYDADHRLIEGPDGRPGLISRDPLRFGGDGALDIRIQAEPPAPGLMPNWLAVQPGPFRLALRVYWPGEAVLNGGWRPPAIQRLAAERSRPGVGRGTGSQPGHPAAAGLFREMQPSGEIRLGLG